MDSNKLRDDSDGDDDDSLKKENFNEDINEENNDNENKNDDKQEESPDDDGIEWEEAAKAIYKLDDDLDDDDDYEDEDEDDEDEDEDEDDDDDDDDDDDNDDEKELIKEINKLQDELNYNPYDYDKHLLRISKLRMIGASKNLREALEKMNEIYPLTPKLWMGWILDEIKMGSTPEEILKLYERAVSEYFHTKIWREYCKYAKDNVNSIGVEDVRNIFEKSLQQAGLDVSSGIEIWNLYREFEFELLCLSTNHDINRFFDLFTRQLSKPLIGMEKTYKELVDWPNQMFSEPGLHEIVKSQILNVKPKYEKALKKLEQLKIYERKLELGNPSNFDEYMEYLEYEKRTGDFPRTQCLYERAITEHCLRPDLWLDYLSYCNSKILIGDILLPIYERAVRNCYWDVSIWTCYMEACEKVKLESTDFATVDQLIQSILQRAIQAVTADHHLNLQMTYLHFLRRNCSSPEQLRNYFKKLIESYGENVDYCFDLYKYHAFVEGKQLNNMDNGRKIWKDFISKSITLKHQAQTWLDYANFEMMLGDYESCRDVLLTGLDNCHDYPENIGEFLLKYERENSTNIQSFFESQAKYKKIMKRTNERRLMDQKKEQERQQEKEKSDSAKNKSATKRKSETDAEGYSKKKKANNEPQPSTSSSVHGETIKTDESKREQTIFVSNLDFDVNEQELSEVFSKFGNVQDVRLVRNYKGLSKGFGYIEFDDLISVHKALQNDRMLIRKRPVYISEMEKRKQFQYGTNKEENKVFVKNIPLEFTQEMLMDQVFSEYKDSILSLRLVTYRNGYSKGIAYIDMKDAESAAKVVQEKDGLEIGDRKLIVAISDPSKASASISTSLGGTLSSKLPSTANKSNNKLTSSKTASATSMVPYSVLRMKPSKVKLQIGDQQQQKPSSSTPSGENNEKMATNSNLNNEQFRSMFLK